MSLINHSRDCRKSNEPDNKLIWDDPHKIVIASELLCSHFRSHLMSVGWFNNNRYYISMLLARNSINFPWSWCDDLHIKYNYRSYLLIAPDKMWISLIDQFDLVVSSVIFYLIKDFEVLRIRTRICNSNHILELNLKLPWNQNTDWQNL